MSELPEGWVETTLGEVVQPRSDKADPASLGNAPFIGMDHIEAHTARLLGTQPVSQLKSAVVVFRKGDILYGRLRPYLNKVHEAEFDGAASAEFIVFPPSIVVERRYLGLVLRQPEFVQLANQRSSGDRPRVKFESLSDFRFLLPPLGEQRRILSKLDNIIERTGRARNQLGLIPLLVERYKNAILASVFERLKDYDHRSLSRIVDSGRGIPYGIVQTGAPYPGGVPTIRGGDIKEYSIRIDGLKKVNPNIEGQYIRTRLRGGEVIISIRGTVGNSAIIEPEMHGFNISREVALIPVGGSVDSKYVMYYLSSQAAQRFLLRHVKGVAQTGINLRDLKNLTLPIPELPVQQDAVRRIEEAFSAVIRLLEEYQKAVNLLDHLDEAICAKAFRGELVPQDSNDEPAAVLLERLRKERKQAETVARQRGRRKRKDGREPKAKAAAKRERRDAMPKKRSEVGESYLSEILETLGGAAGAGELWRQSDMDENEFYKLLRDEVKAGRIVEGADKERLEIGNAA